MKISGIHIRRFRTIRRAELKRCGGLNVLIGKNNSGKSTVLAAIELVQRHLAKGLIAAPWPTTRANDEFTDREIARPCQIGLQLEFPPTLNGMLRARLQEEAPHLEKSIEQLKSYSQLAVIVAGVHQHDSAFLFTQHLGVGEIRGDADDLSVEGINLISVSPAVATELFAFERAGAALNAEIRSLERTLAESGGGRLEHMLENKEMSRYFLREIMGGDVSPSLSRELQSLINSGQGREEFLSRIKVMVGERRSRIEALNARETQGTIAAFAGASKVTPDYATWLTKEMGATSLLHLRETRDRIGRDEAQELLNLKVTRGGPERLVTIQRTVKALLGVDVDAFQAEDARRSPERSAEMDIDQFLVDANGAGIRESLRLILDLELKKPKLVLIEEPEVHLHPGLEHAIYSYLRDRSRELQVFVTTHSTNFVDSVSFQNIYLLSKSRGAGTVCESLTSDQGALKIPAELGLRLSSVFMYDRLVFVEGPSDEAVFREFCSKLNLDLSKANVGFVQMGGVRNFASFAAHSTMELLAHRQIRMWFVADRDERDDAEVLAMMERLGARAKLNVLKQRELENYLLDPEAISAFVLEKHQPTLEGSPPDAQAISAMIQEAALELKDEVTRLRLSRRLLAPIYLQHRSQQGTIEERLDAAVTDLSMRRSQIQEARDSIAAEVAKNWERDAVQRAPGSLVLEKVCQRLGAKYRKDEGDSARLARFIASSAIHTELRSLLTEICQAGSTSVS